LDHEGITYISFTHSPVAGHDPQLIDYYYDQIETHDELKENKAWMERNGHDAEFMDEHIDNQGDHVEKTRVQNSIMIIIHAIAVPIFIYVWYTKHRHQIIVKVEGEGDPMFELTYPPIE